MADSYTHHLPGGAFGMHACVNAQRGTGRTGETCRGGTAAQEACSVTLRSTGRAALVFIAPKTTRK